MNNKTKILLLADANSSHTFKWSTALHDRGFEISIFTLNSFNNDLYENYNSIKIIESIISKKIINSKKKKFLKLSYLNTLKKLKKTIRELKPDIVHAHYASSYGLLGALTKFHPYVLSVWGSDVFDFPRKSFVHKTILKYNLQTADKILSTSFFMADETKKYTSKKIEVTPFGIDTSVFKPMSTQSIFNENDIVIGTIKTLEEKYGIAYLIKTFSIIKKKLPSLPLRLLIVGGGSLEQELKKLCKELNIINDAIFTGLISYNKIMDYYNMLDIYVALSINDSESFGVAILEASACEKPVVVSNIGGLPEVVDNNITGFIVQPKNENEAADAIIKLIQDETLRKSFGKQGREKVKKHFEWNENVNQMINIYKELLK